MTEWLCVEDINDQLKLEGINYYSKICWIERMTD
jgi:hypothetical protein